MTSTGRTFWPLDPRADEIDVRDIARALSNLCRYTGHTARFYSVAEHSCYVSDACSPENALWGLLHDAAEAYLGDVARPTKHAAFGDRYREVEQRVLEAVCERFGLPVEMPTEVHVLDDIVLETEVLSLMPALPDGARWTSQRPRAGLAIECWSPRRAEREFLSRFDGLYEEAS